MPRPKNFDPRQTLDRAMHLFWDQGYEATSLADLERALGVGRKSLYDTFGNKRALFVQALDAYLERRPPVERPGAGWREIVATFNGGPPYHPQHHSCFMVNTTVEQGALEDAEVGERVARHHQALRAGFERALRQAIADGDAPKQDAELGALFLASALQGLSVTARAGASAEQLHAIAARTLASLQSP